MGVRERRLWVLPLAAAKRLQSAGRLVPVPDSVESVPEVYHQKPHEKPR